MNSASHDMSQCLTEYEVVQDIDLRARERKPFVDKQVPAADFCRSTYPAKQVEVVGGVFVCGQLRRDPLVRFGRAQIVHH